jgi:hypothetical protein
MCCLDVLVHFVHEHSTKTGKNKNFQTKKKYTHVVVNQVMYSIFNSITFVGLGIRVVKS